MKVAILGYGIEGKVAYDYWRAHGDDVTIFDDKPVQVPEGAQFQLGPDWQLEGFDLIVRSPGTRPDRIPTDAKTTSVVREFMNKCPAPVIGVTGTKGKGTTTTLITKMLAAAGKTVHIGGNIGLPALAFLDKVKPDDWVVLELSSFQLMDATKSPQVAVCLMIVPEHLNWHRDMDEYVQAKANIFKFQKPSDQATYNANNMNSAAIGSISPGKKLPYYDVRGAYVEGGQVMFQDKVICAVSDVGLLGLHNLDNVCAAVAAVYPIVGDAIPLARAIKEFKGLEHRLELVRELDGVKYYNDSFAANPLSTIAALNAVVEPKVVIIGGFDRDLDLAELAAALGQHKEDLRKILVIGAAGERVGGVLRANKIDNFEILIDKEMSVIVKKASELAQKGDAILLSPGFASFDMYKNFEERGNDYKEAVGKLT